MRRRFDPPADNRPADLAWSPLAWPPAAGLVLEGPVVTLTAADPHADAAELFTALDHDQVWTHVIGRPRDPAGWTAALETRRAAGFPWTVRLSSPLATGAGELPAGTVVGVTSYLEVSVPDARLEIGWTTYTPAVWAGKVNPGTKFLLLGHAFEQLGAGRVQLKTDIRNHRSQQAIHRLGASFEGVLRRYQRRADGTVRDTVLFSITAEEWPAVRVGLLARIGADPLTP